VGVDQQTSALLQACYDMGRLGVTPQPLGIADLRCKQPIEMITGPNTKPSYNTAETYAIGHVSVRQANTTDTKCLQRIKLDTLRY